MCMLCVSITEILNQAVWYIMCESNDLQILWDFVFGSCIVMYICTLYFVDSTSR